MANDIDKIIIANNIKHGTAVVSCKTTGSTGSDIYNAYVFNTPVIEDIEAKYDDQFDDIAYYTGFGDSNVIGV